MNNSSVIGPDTPLWWLGDVFLPLPVIGNVFSVGDLLLGAGCAYFILRLLPLDAGRASPVELCFCAAVILPRGGHNPMGTGTSTRSFGAGKRENHDSAAFYDSRLYDQLELVELDDLSHQDVPECLLNQVFQRQPTLVNSPNNSVHLMVTSPPYNVGKDYDEDLSLDEYRALLREVFAEVFRVLVPGACLCKCSQYRQAPLHSPSMHISLPICWSWDSACEERLFGTREPVPAVQLHGELDVGF